MKLAHCKQHAGSDDDSLNCYRIRHDDGRPASDYEVMSHIDAQAADLARISAELGLPPTIGPAPGYLSGLMESAKAQAAEIERLAEYNQTRTDELSASVAQCVAQRTEIERLRADVKAAYAEGFGALETYNDWLWNSLEEAWEDSQAKRSAAMKEQP